MINGDNRIERIKEITNKLEELLMELEPSGAITQQAIDSLQKALWAVEDTLEIVE